MSDLLSSICLTRGIKINPFKVDATFARDAQLLSDVRALFEQLSLMEGMKKDVSSLIFSDEALTIYSGASSAVADPDPFIKSIKTIEATIRTIDGIKNKKKREKLSGDRANFARMLEIVKKTESKFNAVKKNISAATQETVGQLYSAEQQSSTTIKLINALKSAIVNISLKLSPKTKIELGIGTPGWMDKLSAGSLEKTLLSGCRAAEAAPEAATQPSVEQPKIEKKPEPEKLSYGVRGGAGYGTAKDQKAALQGGASGRYRLSENLSLQLDYQGELYTASSIKQATDDAAASVRFKYGQVELGWHKYKNSVEGTDPDSNGLYLSSRFNYPLSRFILTLDEALSSGYVVNKWQTTGRTLPGITLNLPNIKPFAGGTVGYDTTNSKVIYGGFAGAGARIGRWQEIDLRLDYTNLEGISAQARYFYNRQNWGAGPLVSYNYNLDDKKHSLAAGLTGRLQWKNFTIMPYVEGSLDKDATGNAYSISAGAVIRFGKLQLTRPTILRPYSLDPLPEAK